MNSKIIKISQQSAIIKVITTKITRQKILRTEAIFLKRKEGIKKGMKRK